MTSHPTPAYVYRVVKVFNDNGTGVRGDMQAVISAILLDYEARSPAMLSSPTFGKQREPVLRITAAARAFPAPAPLTGTYSQPTNQTIYCVTPTPHRLTNGETPIWATQIPPANRRHPRSRIQSPLPRQPLLRSTPEG